MSGLSALLYIDLQEKKDSALRQDVSVHIVSYLIEVFRVDTLVILEI